MPFSATGPISENRNPEFVGILTGNFYEDSSYHVVRSQGSRSWLLTLTWGGEGFFLGADTPHTVAKGSLMLVQPGTRQEYGVTQLNGHWGFYWAHFYGRSHWLPWISTIQEVSPGLKYLDLGDSPAFAEVEKAFGRCHAATQSSGRLAEQRALAVMEELLCRVAEAADQISDLDPRIQVALDQINQNLPFETSIATLSGLVGLSVSRFAHLFTLQLALSPRDYVERLRMERAAQMLVLTAHPIHEIADAMGFDNPYYFSRRFRAVTGRSPREHRALRTTGPV